MIYNCMYDETRLCMLVSVDKRPVMTMAVCVRAVEPCNDDISWFAIWLGNRQVNLHHSHTAVCMSN